METLPSYIQSIIVNHKKDIRDVLRKVRETDTPQVIPGKDKVTISPLPEKKPTK